MCSSLKIDKINYNIVHIHQIVKSQDNQVN